MSVELPGLKDYDLPEPPQGERRIAAVRAQLRMLELAKPERPMSKAVAGTLIAAPYRAAVGHANFTIQAYGLSGSLKTSTTVLASNPSGCRMNLRNGPPATWKSTPGFNEHLMFTASDAILLIDDLVPDRLFPGYQPHPRRGRPHLPGAGERAEPGPAELRRHAEARQAPWGW